MRLNTCLGCWQHASRAATGIPLVCVLMLSVAGTASAQGDSQSDEDSLVAQFEQDKAAIAEIDNEIVTLYKNSIELRSSKNFASEEAKSLRLRFPGIVVEETYTIDHFVKSLEDERVARNRSLAKSSGKLAVYLAEKSCVSYKRYMELRRELVSNQVYLTLPLSERVALLRELDPPPNPDLDGRDPCEYAAYIARELADPLHPQTEVRDAASP